jgi:lysophospholipase L1-like esterase
MIRILLIFAGIIFLERTKCQDGDYFIGQPKYPFIQYNDARFILPGDDSKMENLYSKFDSLILLGTGKIKIVHIGGSHVQADVYTHQIRKRLQSLQLDMNGGRGFIFPYRMARTNNPSNYRVSYQGNWVACKNTQFNRTCPLGLSGISVSTSDQSASVNINPNNDPEISYSFTSVKVFHNITKYTLLIKTQDSVYSGIYDTIGGYTLFSIPENWILKLILTKAEGSNESISIFGFYLDNENPGVVYSSIGVNGARLSSFINCQYYSQHLATLDPDLIIFSVGTNDANTRDFNQDRYKIEYEQLIEISKMAAPNAVILITVPNDCYLYKRYTNNNTQKMQEEIISLAQKENYGVWDFYSVMGGLNSSQAWYNSNLMRYDRIHFNKEGYQIKGDLFVTAFLRGWEKNMAERTNNLIYSEKKQEVADSLAISKQ